MIGSDPNLGTTCDAHGGAHIHFEHPNISNSQIDSSPILIPILAPADGVITRIDPCYTLEDEFQNPIGDKYDIGLIFAQDGGEAVSFDLSIEPQDGFFCDTTSNTAADPNFYRPFMLYDEGETVKKGWPIALFYLTTSGSGDAHVHFNLTKQSNHICPNIFNSNITSLFESKLDTSFASSCGFSNPSANSFCHAPTADEDLVTP